MCLGGRAMQIVYDGDALKDYMTQAVSASPEHPVLIDKFLDDAIEIDVDALGDGEEYVIGGIMEHIERAGVHSGDSACSLPPKSISAEIQDEIRRHTIALAKALNVRGLMNAQFAVQETNVFVLEVNPARVAHRAVRQQSDRRTFGENRRAHHGWQNAQGSWTNARKFIRSIFQLKKRFSRSINFPASTPCSVPR